MITAAIALSLAIQSATVSDQLSVRYGLWDTAYRKHDVAAMAKILHPRFRIVTLSGKVIERANYVQGLWRSKAPEAYSTTLLSAKRAGTRGIAITSELSKQRGESEHLHSYQDTWILASGRWLLLESKTLEEK